MRDTLYQTRQKKRGILAIAGLILGITVLSGFTMHGTMSLDPSVKFKVTRSVVDHGDVKFRLTEEEQSYDNHYTMAGVTGPDGNFYTGYHGIGQVLLFAGPYYLYHHVLGIESEKLIRSLIALTLFPLQLALIGWIGYLLLREFDFSPRQSYLAAVLLIFATGLWEMAREAQDGIHVAFLFALCGYGLRRYQKTAHWRWLVLTGLSIGFAFITRSDTAPSVLVVLGFAAWLIHRHNRYTFPHRTWSMRALPYLLLPALTLPFLCVEIFYNLHRFGHPVMSYSRSFDWEIFLIGFKGLLYSPGKGLFWYNPLLLLAIPGFIYLYRRYREWAVAIFLGFAGCFLLHASVTEFHGNICWGPRYLLRYLPLLFIPVAFFLFSDSMRNILVRLVVGLVIAVSALVQVAAVSLHYERELDEMAVAYGYWSAKQWTMFEPEAHILERRLANLYMAVDDMRHGRIPPWPEKELVTGTAEKNLQAPVLRYLAFWPYHMTYYLPTVRPELAQPLWVSTCVLLGGVSLGLLILRLGWGLCPPVSSLAEPERARPKRSVLGTGPVFIPRLGFIENVGMRPAVKSAGRRKVGI